jgi:hypothetical protein
MGSQEFDMVTPVIKEMQANLLRTALRHKTGSRTEAIRSLEDVGRFHRFSHTCKEKGIMVIIIIIS